MKTENRTDIAVKLLIDRITVDRKMSTYELIHAVADLRAVARDDVVRASADVLRRLEWLWSAECDYDCCPICGGHRPMTPEELAPLTKEEIDAVYVGTEPLPEPGHKPGCALAVVLEAAK